MTGNKPVVEKRFEYRGYPCVVIFQTIGHRCGYVGLPKNSKYYEVGYDEIDIDCHGGLTYSSRRLCEQNDTDIWWIGFDCAHCDDAKDYESLYKYYTDDRSREMFDLWKELDQKYPINDVSVKDLDYVIKECKSIVDQLYVREEEDEEDEEEIAEPPMIFGNVLIPMEDFKMAKEALKEELLVLGDHRAHEILNRIFEIALEHAEEDKT